MKSTANKGLAVSRCVFVQDRRCSEFVLRWTGHGMNLSVQNR